MFTRKIRDDTLNSFLDGKIWNEMIKQDCLNQNVFLAIRNNSLGLYHNGGLLFNFDSKGLKTHIKYAAVINSKEDDDDKNYLTEEDLKNYTIRGFKTNYERIKENCSNYSGDEAKGVSVLYHNKSYLSKSDIIVLDVEVAFESFSKEKKKKYDRVDILLYNVKDRALKFVEAKLYNNSEIRSKPQPKVLKQIGRYENQIARRYKNIINGYTEYVHIINRVFDLSLPKPKLIEPKVNLLVFGYSLDQQKNSLKNILTENPAYLGVEYYSVGKITKDLNMSELWKGKLVKV